MAKKKDPVLQTIQALQNIPDVCSTLSDKYVEIAIEFIREGDLFKVLRSKGYDAKKAGKLHYDLLRNKGFVTYVQYLRKHVDLEVFIDKSIMLKKLQEEFLQSEGKDTAKIAAPLLKLLDLDKTSKHITIEVPETVANNYAGDFDSTDVETAEYKEIVDDPKALLQRNEDLIKEIQNDYETEA